MSQIELWLQSCGLEQYIPNFLNSGITPQQFVQIGIQDYNRFGVQSLQDKQKLFKLCSALKAQGQAALPEQNAPAAPRVFQRQMPPSNQATQQAPQ